MQLNTINFGRILKIFDEFPNYNALDMLICHNLEIFEWYWDSRKYPTGFSKLYYEDGYLLLYNRKYYTVDIFTEKGVMRISRYEKKLIPHASGFFEEDFFEGCKVAKEIAQEFQDDFIPAILISKNSKNKILTMKFNLKTEEWETHNNELWIKNNFYQGKIQRG